ncbi:cytochrome d ubiquinol oxidase subunit II [Formicincola oecophyllae]|uniref:Cytochrome d ubiquinol oxidase subunit II n=1 Tax=Formicincola oecophyllae TaxID=2558361 RepID=A0A4Y6U9V1_9PROT|nr:cytochrome d ubiquinol oxidase subunit II [Formicincola oecophyllae]QDH13348.1 cytochrome d ubiquinol oxidase subunit II [Formicincola oecophyllae]
MTTYVILKLIWWVLLGVLMASIGLMVGMDMGVGILLNFIGRTGDERGTILRAIDPHWEGNQTWFILGGGAVFAAFPTLYGTSFSVFYVVMILLLFSMILRPLGFGYRDQVNSARWRTIWDWTLFISGFLPMFVFGAAFGNVMEGVGYHFTWTGQYVQDECFLSYLLNPFAILCGLISVALAIQGGAAILMVDTVDPIYARARKFGVPAGLIAAVLFVLGGFWVGHIKGFVATKVTPDMPANPLLHGQEAVMRMGALLEHFHANPILWAIPAVGILGMVLTSLFMMANKPGLGWWCGVLTWFGVIGTVGTAMFPFLMPSFTNPNQSLTLWNATGSEYGLIGMLIAAAITLPVVFAYTGWSFWVMRGKVQPVTGEDGSGNGSLSGGY